MKSRALSTTLPGATGCLVAFAVLACAASGDGAADEPWSRASENAILAREGFERCERYVEGWLRHADPATGLIPRNLQGDSFWNAKDSAADNYPFMVLTSALLDRPRFEGRMKTMLDTEIRLTNRVDQLPDTYDFASGGFLDKSIDIQRIIFGASEYIKDGLLPLTEWLGPSPWSERMLGMLDDIWAHAPVETEFGRIPSDDPEVNGEMLQVLSRVYWMTGREDYLEWAVRLGNQYLLGPWHPTDDSERLRLRDHGCEIVSGLCELYATVSFVRPEQKVRYREPLYRMLDRILEIGRNDHGMFYNRVNPRSGECINDRLADTWGYTYNGYYTVYLVDGHEPYRDAILKPLRNLSHYLAYDWERGSADGDADSIESALNLYQREPLPSVAAWMDEAIQIMWDKQRDDGVIEGWHGDGNFARTTLLYCLWKTQGVHLRPWRDDLRFGAVRSGDGLFMVLSADKPWTGRIFFDRPRHRDFMHLPLDWPRINQFQEWFAVDADDEYRIHDVDTGSIKILTRGILTNGLPATIEPGDAKRLVIE